jgi:hypothetical protein
MNLSKVVIKIKDFISNQEKVLILLLFLFFCVYSTIIFKNGLIFNSPDENANYFFANLFNQTNSFIYDTQTNTDIVHPRSMTVIDNKIVPQSFLGLPFIYGIIAKVFSSSIIIFLTPLFAVISIWFFYQISKKIFDTKVAFISSLLLLVHPAFIYYTSRSMFHNILFVTFFIVGLYFLVVKKISNLNIFLASLFISLALFVRTSEAPWVFLILLILYILNFKKIDFKKIIIFCFTGLFILIIILFLNQITYGDPLASGYNSKIIKDEIIKTSVGVSRKKIIYNLIANWWNYSVAIFWWLSIPTFLGVILNIKKYKELSVNKKIYLLLFFTGFVYLILYYGNWNFNDTPDPTKITVGTSYVRYWLPIFIFSLPFLAQALIYLADNFTHNKIKKISILVVITFILSYSLAYTYFISDEALAKQTLVNYKEIKNKVLNLTENNSIIVASYFDKLFFPERLVIENIDEERDKRLNEISKLLDKNRLIYYYSWQSDTDINYLNEKVLSKYQLELANPIVIETEQRLFKIIKRL